MILLMQLRKGISLRWIKWVLIVGSILIFLPIFLNLIIFLRMWSYSEEEKGSITFPQTGRFSCADTGQLWGKCTNSALQVAFEYPADWEVTAVTETDLLFTPPGSKSKFIVKATVYERADHESAVNDARGNKILNRQEMSINGFYATLPSEDSDFSFPSVKLVQGKTVFLFVFDNIEESYTTESISRQEAREVFTRMYKSFAPL